MAHWGPQNNPPRARKALRSHAFDMKGQYRLRDLSTYPILVIPVEYELLIIKSGTRVNKPNKINMVIAGRGLIMSSDIVFVRAACELLIVNI
jgi:hypothetical protein